MNTLLAIALTNTLLLTFRERKVAKAIKKHEDEYGQAEFMNLGLVTRIIIWTLAIPLEIRSLYEKIKR